MQVQVYDWDKQKPEPVTELYKRTIAQAQSMSVARLEVKKGATTRLHRHKQEEVIILLRGAWRFHLPTGDITLLPNQMLTIAPGTEHSSEVLEDVVAIDVCAPTREDWINGDDRPLHYDPDQELWAV
jgi:quercetin dioxygenase-like cupin family protein